MNLQTNIKPVISLRNSRFLLFFIFFNITVGYTQPNILWEKKYNHLSGWSLFNSIDTSSNSIFGYTERDYFSGVIKQNILKINDKTGDTIWSSKLYNVSISGDDFSPIKFANNKVYFSGVWLSKNRITDTAIAQTVIIDTNCNLVSVNKFLPKNRTQYSPSSININNSNNDILLFGVAHNGNIIISKGGGSKFTVHNVDKSGFLNWYKVYYFTKEIVTSEYSANMFKYSAQNYMLYGSGVLLTPRKPYVVKIRSNGDTIKTNLYNLSSVGVCYPERGMGLYARNGSVYISATIGANSSYGFQRSLLIKSDTNLVEQWRIVVGTMGCGSSRLIELKNDTILLCTWASQSNRISLYKILPNGTVVDSSSLSANVTSFGEMRGAVLRGNGSLIMAGWADQTAYMVKIGNVAKPSPHTLPFGVPSTLPPTPSLRGNTSITCNSISGTFSYENDAVDYRANYTWQATNATILEVLDNGRTSATLKWNSAGVHMITVTATNSTTNEKSVGMYTVTVDCDLLPSIPIIFGPDTVCFNKILGAFITNTQTGNNTQLYGLHEIKNTSIDGLYLLTATATNLIGSSKSFKNIYACTNCYGKNCNTNSINNVSINLNQAFEIYPNPSKGSTGILVLLQNQRYNISVYNCVGTRIFNYEGTKENIELHNFASGLYEVVLQTDNNKWSKKWVVE